MRHTILCAALSLLAGLMAAGAASAQAVAARAETPSGAPVPRFATLADDLANCRVGPGLDYPVRYVYRRRGLPVMIVAETRDHWRKIRDADGDECWAYRTVLAGPTHALALVEVTMRARPDPASGVRARLAPGVVARLEEAAEGWIRIRAGGALGWAPAAAFWGVAADPAEEGPARAYRAAHAD